MDLQAQLQSTLGGTYTLERELGGGGMSRVFVARETALGRDVVVKVLHPELAAGVNAGRFKREIQLAATLQHPCIVPVHAAGAVAWGGPAEGGDQAHEGLPYYTMPLVHGESLRERLARGGALSLPEVVKVLRDVASALAYAHARGVVHRDIKPDNVLLTGGYAVVTDFGIAKALSSATSTGDGTGHNQSVTATGVLIGTPLYMAPEQAAGDPATDHRADLYALGVLAYELLAGWPPFRDRAPHQLLAAHLGEAPESVGDHRPDAPPALAALVMCCLEKNPGQRPQSATEVVQALDAIGITGAGQSAGVTVALATRRQLGRALGIYAVAFVAVALLARVAIASIGLPDWVFPGALVVMALGLPAILFTAFVYYGAHAARSPVTHTPGGSPTARSTMTQLAVKARPHVSWRRTWTGGAIALAVFVLLVGGFMALRALGIGPAGSLFAKGVLAERERLLVADFRAHGADSALGGVVSEAVRTNLGQSRALTIVPTSFVSAAFQRMQRSATARLDVGLARELAQREGIKAVVSGDITPVGSGFIVTMRLVSAESGDELASVRETAKDPTDLIPAIDRLTRRFRGGIGESLRAVRASPPLERVTTASLPALRKYTEGMRLHYRDARYAEAAAAFEEAIRLDSGFAMAYVRAATSYVNAATRAARRDSLRRLAFERRDRLPDLERALVEGVYYSNRTRRDSAVAAYERAATIDPTQSVVWNQLGILYAGRREYARAESAYRRAIAADDRNQQPRANIVSVLIQQGRFADARRAIAEASRLPTPNVPTLLTRWAAISYLEGRYDSAARLLDSARRLPRTNITQFAHNILGYLYQVRGRLHEGGRLLADALAQNLSAGQLARSGAAATIPLTLDSIEVDVWIRERPPADVARRLDALLARFPRTGPDGMSPDDLLRAAWAYAGARSPDRAQAVLARYDRDVTDSAQRRANIYWQRWAEAEIPLAERRYADAIAAVRASDLDYDGRPHPLPYMTDALLARVFDLADMPDSAVAAYERYVSTPDWTRWQADARYLAGALKRLGELYEAKGDRAAAASYYARFVELWKDADPELQPRVREVRARLDRLSDTERR